MGFTQCAYTRNQTRDFGVTNERFNLIIPPTDPLLTLTSDVKGVSTHRHKVTESKLQAVVTITLIRNRFNLTLNGGKQ